MTPEEIIEIKKLYDDRNLIRESFNIEGIHESDCRSIFFDWALGLKGDKTNVEASKLMLQAYDEQPDDHPMKIILVEASQAVATKPRRGRHRRQR